MEETLAIVILNWNGKEVMKRFLPSVMASVEGDQRVAIYVVDNGSDDGSATWLEKEWSSIRLIRYDENYGYAGGYDRAVREIGAPYTLLLNSDVETPPGWWQPLLSFMEAHPEAGAVQPKILSYVRRGSFEHAGAAGGLVDALGYPYARGRILDHVEPDKGQYDTPEAAEVAWASGAALLVRTSAFLKAGGLDTRFFAHMEEIDLCWRMRLEGYKIYALSSSRVFHLGGGTLPYGNPRKTFLNFRNNLLMLHKNLPRRRGRRFLFIRRLADILGFGFFLIRGKWGDARAVVRAHADFRRMKKFYTEFPDRDILGELPGSDRWLYLEFIKAIFRKK